jgi:hypothetical protein
MTQFKSVAVFCGSAMGNKQLYIDNAVELGSFLATQKITVVYGGAAVGTMGVLANSALKNNGNVVGIIPSFFG